MQRRIPYLILIVLIPTIILSTTVSSIDLSGRPRVRIDKIEIPKLINNEAIKVNEPFEINIYISKERLFPLSGEVVVYLTCAGFIQQEIGRGEDIKINILKSKDKIPITCIIDTFDANTVQEKYSIVAVLYAKKIIGGFREKDRSSVENVNIATEWWEKNKVIISDFEPPEKWEDVNNDGYEATAEAQLDQTPIAEEKGVIKVNISNNAVYNFSIKIKVYMIEKSSTNIPFIEGIGEIKKEIGCINTTIPAGEKNEVNIKCSLREADREKKSFNVQAVLYVDVDGQWYEVDTSSIQSIKVPYNLWDGIKEYGLWIWIVFIASIGTVLLIAVTVRLFLPYYKLKSKELKQKIEKIEKKKKK
jgi:hypothetical protein